MTGGNAEGRCTQERKLDVTKGELDILEKNAEARVRVDVSRVHSFTLHSLDFRRHTYPHTAPRAHSVHNQTSSVVAERLEMR